jgi:hypothetical protein
VIIIERTNLMAGVVILVSIAIGIAPLAVKETSVQQVNVEYNTSVNVENTEQVNLTELGINPGQSLQFGNIEQNANYTKWVSIGVNERSRVSIESSGNISELLRHDELRYVKGQTRIPIELFPHKEGYHEGKVELNVWRPRNWLGELYIDYWQWKDRNF